MPPRQHTRSQQASGSTSRSLLSSTLLFVEPPAIAFGCVEFAAVGKIAGAGRAGVDPHRRVDGHRDGHEHMRKGDMTAKLQTCGLGQ